MLLGNRSYEVVIGEGVRSEVASTVAARCSNARAAAIISTPSLVEQPWFDIDTGLEQRVVIVPDGEAAKTMEVVTRVVEELASFGLSRNDVIVGVGGGATTDLAGFVAAIYLRGVAVLHVPTSLAAQVDAAIGGKTGVDLLAGKNLVGAFHQPVGVLCDLDTLETLPARDVRAGLGEVAKCWLLRREGVGDIASASLLTRIAASIELKARVVSGDELDAGERALLNYGHTLGHALERVALDRGKDELRHGEAVAIGLAFAARLARQMGRVGDDVVAYHDGVLAAFGLSGSLPSWAVADELIALMARDKKAHHDLTFVLDGPNGYETVSGVEASNVRDALDRWRGKS